MGVGWVRRGLRARQDRCCAIDGRRGNVAAAHGGPSPTRQILAARTVLLFAVLFCVSLAQAGGAATASAKGRGYSLTPSTTTPYTPCPPGGRMIECNIVIDPHAVKTSAGYQLPGGGPLFEGGGELGGYDPANLQSAYDIPTSGGSGETVALIDAYGYKEAEADLAKYREKYGLAACTKASGCFKKVNEKGEEKNYPAEGGELEKDWSLESALDVDMVSAACPGCHIMLVEATTQEPKDTAAAAEEAATLGATEISNSYGYPENNETWCPAKKGCAEYLSSYKHTGIPVTVSAGDSAYDNSVGAPSWPATSPNVIAVGGTNLNKSSNSRGWNETVWNDSGSGCSLYETKPAWQFDTGCSKRTDNDVSAVASPETPVSVYNTPYTGGWVNVGGTSASAPLVAAIEAHANSATKTAGAEAFYKHPGMLYDVVSGSNGTCTPPSEDAYLCRGEIGYDGPTGWGTPNGVFHVSGWFTHAIPNLVGKRDARNVALTSVSCVSSASCMAAGHYLGASGSETALVEHWNGSEWSQVEIPTPGSAKSSTLSSISCLKVALFLEIVEECDAVGHYVNSSGVEVAFAEEWDHEGSRVWVIKAVAVPAEAKSSALSGVSCGEKICLGVGRYVNSAGKELTLVDKAGVGEWALVETPLPAEAKSAAFLGVSCLKEYEDCDVVGHYVSSAGTETILADVLLLGKWTLQSPLVPAEAKSSSLSSVSCVASCSVAGHYVNAAGKEVTLVEYWNLEKWVIQESPNPAGAKSAKLSGLSCQGPETCTAVGSYVNSGTVEVTLAETFTKTGKKWELQESPNPAEAKSSGLAGISCASAEACTAAGHYVNSLGSELTLGEVFTSTEKKWAIQTTVNPKEATGNLAGASCSATEACTAVGHYLNDPGTELTLAERWNGKEWSLQETPNPSGAKGSTLASVSCAGAEACTAVGHYVNSSSKEVTLGEVWSSKKWTVQEPPNPAEAKASSLSGVSCTAAEACTAVGHYVTSGGVEETLAEVFTSTAKKWAIQESPNPAGAKASSLSGVSCTAAEACTAVGHYVTSGGVEETLAEVFTSTAKKWAIQESPNPAGAKSAALAGVSCTAAEACTTVGHYVTSGGVEETLAEVFTSAAKKWAIQESPNPTGAKSAALSGLSCTAAEECTAVGHYVTSGGVEGTLAEAITSAGKKWAIQETPNSEGAQASSLSGVSCKTASVCTAAGHATEGSGTETALVEEHA